MKLYWTLHETAELHTDLSPEDAEKTMRSAVGAQFHGTETDGSWVLSHHDHNVFRPAVQVELVPGEDGTLIRTAYRMDRTLLIFMCVWTVLDIVLSILWNPLLAVTLVLFWGAVLVGFSLGVSQSHQDLMNLFGAYEILE